VDLVQIAYITNDPALRRLLANRGIKADLKSVSGPPGSVPMSGLFVMTGFSMRPNTAPGVRDGVDAILALGADPNADVRQLARALPPVSLAALCSDTEAIRAFGGCGPYDGPALGLTHERHLNSPRGSTREAAASESVEQPKLQSAHVNTVAGSKHAGDAAESRAVNVLIGGKEVRVIEDVEDVSPEVDAVPLVDFGDLPSEKS
jgi:hypothetical protein